MKTKILAWLMVLVLVVSMLPTAVFADESASEENTETTVTPAEDATVSLTVGVKGVLATDTDGNVMANRTVTVKDLNEDGILTFDEALVAAHKAYCPDGYATSSTAYGVSVTKLWGVQTYSTLYMLNDKPLSMGVADKTSEVKAGDRLYAAVLTDETYYSDYYTYFDRTAFVVSPDEEFTLNLQGFLGMSAATDIVAVSDVKIGTWVDGEFVAIEGATTDADGNVTLSFAEMGKYYITASGVVENVTVTDYTGTPDENWVYPTKQVDAPILAPVCVVNVVSGVCGENVAWDFSELTGTLTISGTGKMEDYSYNVDAPWNEYINDIGTIVVEEGVTYIGKYAFNKATYTSLVRLPSTLTEIGSNGFGSQYAWKVTPMVAFGGTQEQWDAIKFNYSAIKSQVFTYNAARDDAAQITDYPSSDFFFISDDNADNVLSVTVTKPAELATMRFTWYVNETNSAVGGTPVDEKLVSVSEDGLTSYCTPDLGIYGTRYYYCVVSSEIGEETVEVNSTISTVEVMQRLWSGRGTQENPFKLATSKDLVKLSDLVASGYPCTDMYFAITANITLPKDWTPIGGPKEGVTYTPAISYKNMNLFKGHIDGLKNAKTGECYTITVPAGEKTMVGAIVGGSVTNLNIYGKRIEGYGVVEYYFNMTSSNSHNILIENVTLKSGTHTKYSGFIGGYASGVNTVTIRNCTVEEGVVIGDDGTYAEWAEELSESYSYPYGPAGVPQYNDMIGSFAGAFNGTIENCVSYAKVYGRDYVGGIAGYKGQSMGDCIIRNCVFAGEVHATGELAGGILGAGYVSSSAPNTPCVTIENCAMIGSVAGNDKVGGILGGNTTAAQCWNNGVGYIRGNYVSGSVKGNCYVGGVIGYLMSLDRYNIISGNYYLEGIAERGIGFVYQIDTSNEARKTSDYTEGDTLYFDTSAGGTFTSKGWYDKFYTDPVTGAVVKGVSNKNHNRTDDPLGVDADKLTATFTRAELKNGKLMRKLNEAGAGYAWQMNDGKLTVTGDRVVVKMKCTALNSSNPIRAYWSKGLATFDQYTVTITYSDGTTKDVKASECIIDVDLTQSGYTLASITYGDYTLCFGIQTVADEEPSEEVKANDVNIMIGWLGIELIDEPATVSVYAMRAVRTQSAQTGITIRDKKLFEKIKAAYDALSDSAKELVEKSTELDVAEAELDAQETAIEEEIREVLELIEGIGEVDASSAQKIVEARAAYENLSDDAKLYIDYYSDSEHEDLIDAEEAYAEQLQEVIDLIEAIGQVNYFSAGKIQTARDAYDALSEDDKAYMVNCGYYDVLVEAEEAYTELIRGEDGANGENGADGADGKDGITPQIRINPETNMWEVSYDNGETWISLGVPATGDKGEQGEKGDKGDTGAQGEKGDKGDTGAQGEKGDKGDTGAQGEKGDKGDTGAQGEKGDKGDTGAQGEKGDKGDTGAQGEKGDKGDTGAQGEKGDKGDTGAQGEKGDKGDTGAQGEKGDNGADGANGKDGANGVDGKNGQDANGALTTVAISIASVSLLGNIAVAVLLLMKKKNA